MEMDEQLTDALKQTVIALNETKDELRSARSANTIQRIMVTNEAKSDLPWLMHMSVTAAIVSMVLTIITLIGGGMLYLNMKDHLDAIYMVAPSLQHQLETKDTSHVHEN